MEIILGSSSKARKSVLSKLRIPFSTQSPDIDETTLPGEEATTLVERLGKEKAAVISKSSQKKSLIITGDQVVSVNEKIFGKPLTHERAVEQLHYFSGKKVEFTSSICLLNNYSSNVDTRISITTVKFRTLDSKLIEKYLLLDKPYNCAGSFKSESLSPCLIEYLSNNDPSAIMGLPLIQLCEMLAKQNYHVLDHAK